MSSITLKGREIPLMYTTYEMKVLQEQFGPLGEFDYKLLGKNKDDPEDTSKYGGTEQLDTVAGALRILGNAGLEDAGEDANLTDKWILRALRPAQLIDAVKAIMTALQEGNRSEIPEKKQTGPVDVTLEEIKKNETKES